MFTNQDLLNCLLQGFATPLNVKGEILKAFKNLKQAEEK